MSFDGKSILVTGGTGTFGKQFVATLLERYRCRRLVVFSRDELKQHEMRLVMPDGQGSPLRYFIGDVRDSNRLRRAFNGVDIVVHAAALKQVPACEYNPIEAIETNITGARNVVDAALDCGVSRVIAISTDKAVNPINIYGATKLCAEKLVVHANAYSGSGETRFAVCRYGNVVGSRGSVIPVFRAQQETGRITVTDERMTRFWITLRQGVDFVLQSLESMSGGEIFVPKIPSMNIVDLAKTVAPGCEIDVIGIRPGEKLHEVLLSADEARTALEHDGQYIVYPPDTWTRSGDTLDGKAPPEGFAYTSDQNDTWLESADLLDLLKAE